MNEVVFFLEEESAKALLERIFPHLIPPGDEIHPRFIVFEGKQDLEKQLPNKLRGYLNPRARFIVMRDQDQADCRKTKRTLAAICTGAGHPQTTVRIACRELEAFYIGDLLAVEKGLDISGLAGKQAKAKFRDPDRLVSPSFELQKLTGNRYHKVAGSRAIAPHLNLQAPRSRSFHHLIRAIRRASDDLYKRTH
ncbi:MAG TPA: DUF4276 family protein [Bryobacteraceae bacterium]|nr:DUF4276 family protein [Bryobacteraceae bacterium]